MADADTDQISWIEWSYCGCGDPTGTIPPSIEGLVSDPRLAGTGANVDTAKLAVLAEPYPRVVSGTPESYSFDLGSHTFESPVHTRSPSGKAFPAGSCTAVVIPPFNFPHGYVVSVTARMVTFERRTPASHLSQTGTGARRHSRAKARIGSATVAPDPRSLTGCT